MFTKKKVCLKHYLEIQTDIELAQSRRMWGPRMKKRDGQIFHFQFVSIVKPQFDSSSLKLLPFNYLLEAT